MDYRITSGSCNIPIYSLLRPAILVLMSEILDFVRHGSTHVTPNSVEKLLRILPYWKAEFAQINAPQFPHLVNQLEFLADAVEDFAEGAYKDLPYTAFSEAVFALVYAHQEIDIIPDYIDELGRADDSSVVRAVLISHKRAFEKYAISQGFDWKRITSDP